MGSRPVALVGRAHQLLVDDFLIAQKRGMARSWYELRRPFAGPVLCPVMPWEGSRVIATGNVRRDPDDGLFKMWYLAGSGNADDWPSMTLICHATSTDGVQWTRPALGIHAFRGSLQNNIVAAPCIPEGTKWRFGPFSNTVNPHDHERPHKALAFSFNQWKRDPGVVHPSGTYLMTSSDGLHWDESARPLWYLADGYGDGPRLMYDASRRRYMAFLKVYEDSRGRPLRRQDVAGVLKSFVKDGSDEWVELAENQDLVRRRAIAFSDDLVHWTEPRYILPIDDQDNPGDQTYTLTGWPYESMYLGLLTIYHLESHGTWTAGTQHIEPVYSRDGEDWVRPGDRSVVFPPGRLHTDWDQGAPFFFSHAQPIRVGDELWFYYNAHRRLHKIGPYDRGDQEFGAVGLATLRVDGFASMDASASGGSLVTRPVKLAGQRLFMNADAAQGQVQVEVRDTEGKPLRGRRFADAVPVREDATRVEVRWRGANPTSLRGRVVQLAMRAREASIYSFWTE